jgi:hypothetical protein
MGPAQLAQAGLNDRSELVWTAARPMGAVGQGVQTALLVATQPTMDCLSGHAVALGYLNHHVSVAEHLHDGVVALLDHAELQQHRSRPPPPIRQRR